MNTDARERVLALVDAARRIADPGDPLGIDARRILPAATGLSPANVEDALVRCLETRPTEGEIDALVGSVPRVPVAHVVLSSNVFVAAHRALALGLAAAPVVRARPSRREPEMARLLARGAPGLFELVPEIDPAPGHHVWAYGSDDTLRALSASLPAGVTLHAHGSGFGVVVLELSGSEGGGELARVAGQIALDVVPFDQRGCLSPRVVLVTGAAEGAARLAGALAEALAEIEGRIPLGTLSADERAAAVLHREAWLVAGRVISAGRGMVTLDEASAPLTLPPVGRNVHVRFTPDLPVIAPALAPSVAAVGASGRSTRSAIAAVFPRARVSEIGEMQQPAFDGPVDRRRMQPLQ